MGTFKKTKVVMLPTNEKAPTHDYLFLYKPSNRLVKNGFVQHLYFLSDEEIKEGDWMLHNLDKKPIQWNGEEAETNPSVYGYKKIIATTELLTSNINLPVGSFNYLPQLSQSFIEKYVEEYNKGSQIKEVLVEYEEYGTIMKDFKDINYRIKINPKDNTITIRKVKDSWSRDEVKQLCWQAFIDFKCIDGKIKPSEAEKLLEPFNKWIEENL